MAVSRQARSDRTTTSVAPGGGGERTEERGPRARMQRALLDTAMDLMQRGRIPSISDVAEAAGVSRATAYRYFPSQAAMIKAASDEALGPVFSWTSDSEDAEERITNLLAFAYPHIDAYEATHRATLLMSLDQWARRTAGTLGEETRIVRGHRRRLLAEAVGPLRERLGKPAFDRLTQSLSLIFGTEAFVVLKDIWSLDADEARRTAVWAAHALVRAALADAAAQEDPRTLRGTARKGTAKVRRKLN